MAAVGPQSPDSASTRLHNLDSAQKGISMKRDSSRLILLTLIFLVLTFGSVSNAIVQPVPGDLDPSFGTVGKVTTDFGVPAIAQDIALQSDGKIVVAGATNEDFAVARYNPDGTLDAAFGAAGKVVTDFGNGFDE